jgi:predicted transcriptional regulator
MNLNMDLTKTGLDMFFKPYQVKSLNLLWSRQTPQSSRQVWDHVNNEMAMGISRASIINFLNASVENGLLDYVETTGKGGYRRLYSSKHSRSEASVFLSEKVENRLQTLKTT